MIVYSSIPPPSDSSHGDWNVWIIGTIITALLSFTRGKWGPLVQFKEKIETTIEEAERVADIVEEVAEEVEKVAKGVVKHLPEGKLQNAAELVENAAENVYQHAQNAEDLLEKVEELEKEVDSFFESTILKEESVVPTTDSRDPK
ncbi:Glycine-tRNA synthetase [Vigna unguiculata]|uniref:Glycine-tRNA synthetase n=1 Tax=Vigna unguiculata TaxID=3917 RepID=A0A4D6MGX3_VIGUN|nr:Glycine-tRNA synthetase [Vigna unguiculata]